MKKNVIRNTIIVVLICCILFIGGYYFTGRIVQEIELEEFVYNGFNFTIDDSKDMTFYILQYYVRSGMEMVPGTPIPFRSDPRVIDSIPCDVTRQDILNNKLVTFYFTQDPELEIKTKKKSIVATETITRILDATKSPFLFPIDVEYAYTSEKSESSLPVVICEDANNLVKVITLREAKETAIITEGNCIYVQGANGDEMIKAAERFVYSAMGVM